MESHRRTMDVRVGISMMELSVIFRGAERARDLVNNLILGLENVLMSRL